MMNDEVKAAVEQDELTEAVRVLRGFTNHHIQAVLTALQSATARADKAEAALRKYADAKNWKCSLCVHDAEHVDGICCNDFFEPTLDGYEIARQALKESKDETR